MGIFVHRACNRCPVVSNAVNSSSSHRSRPRHVLTACKTWPQLGAQAQVCHSPPHQQQPCVYGTQNHHCSVAGMLNSPSTLGKIFCAWRWLWEWSGTRLLPNFDTRIQSLGAKQMQTNASKTRRLESNICEKTDKANGYKICKRKSNFCK